MDWNFWLLFTPGFIQAVVVVLDYFGIRPNSVQIEESKRTTVKVVAALMLMTWGAVGYDLYDRSVRSSPQWSERPLIQVRDKKFVAQTVPLDGYEYINCDFDDVSFNFQGTAPSRITDSRVQSKPGDRVGILRSENPIVNQTMRIIAALHSAAGSKEGRLQ